MAGCCKYGAVLKYLETSPIVEVTAINKPFKSNKKNSAIFVLPTEREKERIKIVEQYEKIFAETN